MSRLPRATVTKFYWFFLFTKRTLPFSLSFASSLLISTYFALQKERVADFVCDAGDQFLLNERRGRGVGRGVRACEHVEVGVLGQEHGLLPNVVVGAEGGEGLYQVFV